MTTFNIFHTTRVRIGVRDAPHIWGAGEIRDAGERRLFGGLARSEPFVTPHVWGTGEMSTEISAPYLGRWGNKHWKSRRIYVALGHDELRMRPLIRNTEANWTIFYKKLKNNTTMIISTNIRITWENHCGIVKNIIHQNKKSSCQSKFQLPDGNLTSDKKIISEKFNDCFVNVCPTLAKKNSVIDKSPLSYMHSRIIESIFLSPVTPVEISKLLLTLKDSATGWDEINAMFWKTSLNCIRYPCVMYVTCPLKRGFSPHNWKLLMFCLSLKQKSPLISIITGQCHYCAYYQRFLRK